MEIIQYLNLAAEEYRMSEYAEDKLDYLVVDVLAQTELLSLEELEHVQAAALPFGVQENKPNS